MLAAPEGIRTRALPRPTTESWRARCAAHTDPFGNGFERCFKPRTKMLRQKPFLGLRLADDLQHCVRQRREGTVSTEFEPHAFCPA